SDLVRSDAVVYQYGYLPLHCCKTHKYLIYSVDRYIRSRPLLILTMRRMQSARMAAAMTNSTMATALGWPETVRNRTPTAVRNAVIMSSMETQKVQIGWLTFHVQGPDVEAVDQLQEP